MYSGKIGVSICNGLTMLLGSSTVKSARLVSERPLVRVTVGPRSFYLPVTFGGQCGGHQMSQTKKNDTNSPAEVTIGIKVKNPDKSSARLKISIQLDQGYLQMSN